MNKTRSVRNLVLVALFALVAWRTGVSAPWQQQATTEDELAAHSEPAGDVATQTDRKIAGQLTTALDMLLSGATGAHVLDLSQAYARAEQEVTMLGVHVRATDRTLQRHLKLPPGVGLLVDHVVEGSAAAEVMEPDDVLHRLDDQILVNVDQLTTLIRMRKPGDTVSLSLIREGQPGVREVVLKLGEVHVGASVACPVDEASDALLTHVTDSTLHSCATCHQMRAP